MDAGACNCTTLPSVLADRAAQKTGLRRPPLAKWQRVCMLHRVLVPCVSSVLIDAEGSRVGIAGRSGARLWPVTNVSDHGDLSDVRGTALGSNLTRWFRLIYPKDQQGWQGRESLVSSEEEILAVLKAIQDELSLLTLQVKARSLRAFEQEFLTSPERKKMFQAFDGSKTCQQIAEHAGVSERAVQYFVKELEDNNLIDVRYHGRNKIPSRNLTKIALRYTRDVQTGGVSDEEERTSRPAKP